MGGGVMRSLVMHSFGVRSGLMMDSLGMCSGLVMFSFRMGSGLMMLGFRMGNGLVMRSFGMGTGLVMSSFGMGSGPVVDRFGLCALVMDRLGMCRSSGMWAPRVRTGSGLDRGARLAVIDREVLIAVISSLLLMSALRCGCLEMTIVSSRFLGGSRSGVDSTWTVEADAIICRSIIDHCTIHIGVVDDIRIHTPSRGIIPERVALPPTSGKTGTIITEAIVDSPVVSNVRTPITVVPMIESVAKTPVTRGPEVSRLGHLDPSARNPEITIVSIGPVAWTPKISVVRTRRLLVGDEGRRGHCNRNSLSEKRSRWAEQTGEENRSSGFH
jgi:hypothetical protein